MAPRSPLSEGEIASGDEEKAISTKQDHPRASRVNQDHRRPQSSSRTSHGTGYGQGENKEYGRQGYDRREHGRQGYSRQENGRQEYGRQKYGTQEHGRARSRSPHRRHRSDRSSVSSRSSSRSERAPRGSKRRRHEDHYSMGDRDARSFKVSYEPEDADSADHRSHRTSERYRRPHSAQRERSPSPWRPGKGKNDSIIAALHRQDAWQENNNLSEPGGDKDRSSHSKPEQEKQSDPGEVKGAATTSRASKGPSSNTATGVQAPKTNGATSDDHNTMDTAKQPQLSEAEAIELRRKRREAIRNKHKSERGLLVQALEQNITSTPATPVHESSASPSLQQSPISQAASPDTSARATPPESPAALVVESDLELVNKHQADSVLNEYAGPSAADYHPSMDMQEDRIDRKRRGSHADDEKYQKRHQAEGDILEASKEFDMFADDGDDDMFASTDKPSAKESTIKQAKALDVSLLDNWDHPDGHLRIIQGELMDGRYAVIEQVGKGSFATVIRAHDNRTDKAVAVKIACNNDTMYKAAKKEMDMLKLLNREDPDDKKHIIRMERSFMHKGHLCLVFESLNADLRAILKKFGTNSGLNIMAIRNYAQQIFLALSLLKKCEVLHADIKPDNILVSEQRSVLKVCDLGTAAFIKETEITPYLVSRFYRAPEVSLGMELDYAMDMWSVGCTLFELYTGRILFAGHDNNQMLRAIQECRGKIPMRMLKKAKLAGNYFDAEGGFHSRDYHQNTGKLDARILHFTKAEMAGKDLKARLSINTKGMNQEELSEHATLVNLLDRCLQLDPAKRITPNDALRHTFVNPPKPVTAKPKGGSALLAPPKVK